jgi:hypothetical protein
MIRSAGLVLMAVLFGLGIAAYALRWLWLAMIAVALLLFAYSAARGESLHEYSAGMIPPTPAEEADIAEWVPIQCCRSNGCCFKVPASALHPLSRDEYRVNATGQIIRRTGWSRDGQTWRCACDDTGKGWKVHMTANTRCIFPAMSGY